MSQINTPLDVIQLLRGIEQRSQQEGNRLSQQGERQGTWTAVDFKIATQLLTPTDRNAGNISSTTTNNSRASL
jgi:hypothetical protein